ncbi:hypothetical protein K1T71_009399 [Dendrolimus kikuchii]|uniref:Uncharacterized protein n=1 Tax=Dendrolimus kikuchii TaxID=765133 RepID=A0ACC1CUQ3_9NEOP|nr:hypothetical protein K1T71_009399 [Dendrolimus kikuchii]
MYHNGIFVFGTKIFGEATKRDAITSLPLELSWKIFSYLDDLSLRIATHTHKTWARIIASHPKLRRRLNKFDLTIKLGSEALAKFYRRNKRKLKKEIRKNYVPLCESTVISVKRMTEKSKRTGEDIVTTIKRYKLY